MSRQDQLRIIRLQREELAQELEIVYNKAFDQLSDLDLGEKTIARLAQLFLQSKEGAIEPLKKEIEKPLITGDPTKS